MLIVCRAIAGIGGASIFSMVKFLGFSLCPSVLQTNQILPDIGLYYHLRFSAA